MSEFVTPDNFNRAESDTYFAIVARSGGFEKFEHHRDVVSIDRQTIVRPNRDTLYSSAVFDLHAGPVTVTLPDAGTRFMSLQVIDEDQYAVAVVYGEGTYTFTRDEVGTRYALIAIRILVDPRSPCDVAEVNSLQDEIEVQHAGSGRFEIPQWDSVSQNKVRNALVALSETVRDSRHMFGARGHVEPVRHLIGSAIGWGGNPEQDATYLLRVPPLNDGTTIYRLTLKDVPVDGFWSISVYNAKGYFEPNRHDAYTLNSITSEKNPDGSVTIQFGGYDGRVANCLPIMPGWNYTVRLYRPRPEILNGTWTFPEAEPVTPELQHATDAVVWGTPIVSFDAMRQAYFRDAGAHYNDILYWSKPANWKTQITTPNASTRYVYFNFNTTEGAVILEIPPAAGAGLFGSVLDAWQVPIADIGPQGLDEGRGGRYLLLPPGDETTRIAGTIPVQLATHNGYGLLRAIPQGSSEAAVERALELVRKLRVYPAARIDSPPSVQRLIDMTDQLFDGIVRFDGTFFASLAGMLAEEPVAARDMEMMRQLAMLGVERGRRFAPDFQLRALHAAAARAAYEAYMRAGAEDGSLFWTGRRWRWPSTIGAKTGFTFVTDQGLDVHARGLVYFLACAPPVHLGKATAYLTTFVDRDGRPLDGRHTYRLHVPPGVPATQFWAATVYDVATAAFVRGSPRIEVNSYERGIAANGDGSIDLYFGPRALANKEMNWIYTAPGGTWFTMFRLYGPTLGLFDKDWQLSDLELVEEDR
jgi:hypothetical protein